MPFTTVKSMFRRRRSPLVLTALGWVLATGLPAAADDDAPVRAKVARALETLRVEPVSAENWIDRLTSCLRLIELNAYLIRGAAEHAALPARYLDDHADAYAHQADIYRYLQQEAIPSPAGFEHHFEADDSPLYSSLRWPLTPQDQHAHDRLVAEQWRAYEAFINWQAAIKADPQVRVRAHLSLLEHLRWLVGADAARYSRSAIKVMTDCLELTPADKRAALWLAIDAIAWEWQAIDRMGRRSVPESGSGLFPPEQLTELADWLLAQDSPLARLYGLDLRSFAADPTQREALARESLAIIFPDDLAGYADYRSLDSAQIVIDAAARSVALLGPERGVAWLDARFDRSMETQQFSSFVVFPAATQRLIGLMPHVARHDDPRPEPGARRDARRVLARETIGHAAFLLAGLRAHPVPEGWEASRDRLIELLGESLEKKDNLVKANAKGSDPWQGGVGREALLWDTSAQRWGQPSRLFVEQPHDPTQSARLWLLCSDLKFVPRKPLEESRRVTWTLVQTTLNGGEMRKVSSVSLDMTWNAPPSGDSPIIALTAGCAMVLYNNQLIVLDEAGGRVIEPSLGRGPKRKPDWLMSSRGRLYAGETHGLFRLVPGEDRLESFTHATRDHYKTIGLPTGSYKIFRGVGPLANGDEIFRFQYRDPQTKNRVSKLFALQSNGRFRELPPVPGPYGHKSLRHVASGVLYLEDKQQTWRLDAERWAFEETTPLINPLRNPKGDPVAVWEAYPLGKDWVTVIGNALSLSRPDGSAFPPPDSDMNYPSQIESLPDGRVIVLRNPLGYEDTQPAVMPFAWVLSPAPPGFDSPAPRPQGEFGRD